MTSATGDMKSENRIGPRTLPRGTPMLQFVGGDMTSLNFTSCDLFVRLWREPVYGRWFDAEGVTEAIDDGGVV